MADIIEVMERAARGAKTTKAELAEVVQALNGIRLEFLHDAFQAVDELQPGTQGFEAFKNCILGLGTILVRNGVLSIGEMQKLLRKIEGRELHRG